MVFLRDSNGSNSLLRVDFQMGGEGELVDENLNSLIYLTCQGSGEIAYVDQTQLSISR